jgi:hypothetical protein
MIAARRTATVQISRRALCAALLAAATLGIAIGEAAAPLSSSQARPLAGAATVPAACDTFASEVGTGFEILGTILEDSAKYPPLIPKAEQAGAAMSSAKLAAITASLNALNSTIDAQASRFESLKGPLLDEERKCLG